MTTEIPVHCRFCNRTDINRHPTTRTMRFHRVPAGTDVGVIGVSPGDRCPGTSSDSYWTADDPDRPAVDTAGTDAAMFTKAAGWIRPEPGVYTHTATGIEVRRGDYGTPSGGTQSHWMIRIPNRTARGYATIHSGIPTRAMTAERAAGCIAYMQSRQTAAHWDAVAEDHDRDRRAWFNRAYPVGSRYSTGTVEERSYETGEVLVRERNGEGYWRAVDKPGSATDADSIRGDRQYAAFSTRAYMSPFYDEARPTRSHESSMLYAKARLIDAAQDEAIRENLIRAAQK